MNPLMRVMIYMVGFLTAISPAYCGGSPFGKGREFPPVIVDMYWSFRLETLDNVSQSTWDKMTNAELREVRERMRDHFFDWEPGETGRIGDDVLLFSSSHYSKKTLIKKIHIKNKNIINIEPEYYGRIQNGYDFNGSKMYYKNFNFEFNGKMIDLSYRRLSGWPVPNRIDKMKVVGFTGELMISRKENGTKKILATVKFEKQPIIEINHAFFQSPKGKYLFFRSGVEPGVYTYYVFSSSSEKGDAQNAE